MRTKWLVLGFLVALLLTSCSPKFSSDGTEEKAVVESFLAAMNDNYDDNAMLLGYISPKQMQKLGASPADAMCNAYHYESYDVTGYDRKAGEVRVMLYGTGGLWQHELTFALTKEDDKLYLVPMQYDEGFVDPWAAVQENVGQEQKDFVGEFLQHMMDDYNDEPLLLGYISPAYYSQNGLNIDRFKCNAYSPVEFDVGKYDPATGKVTTIIRGEDDNWGHKLVFKVVQENGRMYLWPGSHSETYIDPWYAVELNVL